MSKRKWTDMKQYKEIILRMVSEGGTRKSIADELGLEPKQIKNFMYRYRASKKKTEPPKRKGRPRSVTPHTEKRSLQSCNFTVTKGFSTPHKRILP